MASSSPLRDSARQFSKAAIRPLRRLLRSKATQYCYAPLDESAKQIRILTLLPGKFSAKIQVSLKIVQLSTEYVPDFEALSYCWGSEKDPAEILIETRHGFQVLMVTQNLAEALHHLRYETQPRILWIDAICIDQQNFLERSSQVKQMADIYTLSWRVVVWLGPEYNNSSLALNLLDSLGSKLQVDWVLEAMKVTCEEKSEQHWADRNEVLPYKECEISALISIFDRPWFERLWILQEIWMAGPFAILLCGKTTCLWKNFRNAFFCISNKDWRSFEQMSLASRYVIYMLCQQSKLRSFPWMLEGTRYSKCTDPRDRIFALLSLLDPQDAVAAIGPDYNKDVTEIYIEVFLRYSQKARHLKLMGRCEFGHEASGFPTWLPNWSVQKSTDTYHGSASGKSAAVLGVIEKERIRVCGIAIGTLGNVARHSIWDSTATTYIGRDFELQIHAIAQKLSVQDTELEAFCKVLGCGTFAEETYPQSIAFSHHPSLLQSIAYVSSIAKTTPFDEAHLSADDRNFVEMAANMIRGRSIYRTSDGILGLAPTSAEPGDVIVVMFGLQSPMVLRPTHGKTYKVVGESYCYGYMSCEGFLGPLPDTHKMVWLMDKTNRTIHESYLDIASGVVQIEDPRSGELPQGWKLSDHDQKHLFPVFVNQETGEDTWCDPRLTPEALKARGVDVEYFDLI